MRLNEYLRFTIHRDLLLERRGISAAVRHDLLRRPFREHEALKQAIACQTVGSMHAVAAGLAYGEEMLHGGLRIAVHVNAAHKVMLSRHDRDRFLGYVVAFFKALLIDAREMMMDRLRLDILERKPHVLAALSLHLLLDRS